MITGVAQRFGQGEYAYELVEDWVSLPAGWELPFSAPAVASDGSIFLFTRSEHPVIALDEEGRFVKTWGEGRLTSAHHVFIDQDDHLWLPVFKSHVVLKCTRDGDILLTLGEWDEHANPEWNGTTTQWLETPLTRSYGPFCLPTDVAVAPDRTVYVTDGYANARVHRFSEAGELMSSWGVPGREGAGAFFTPHAVCVHEDGRVFVADRQNNRIQIFDPDGEYLEEWDGFNEPGDIAIVDDVVYVAEGAGAFKTGGLLQIRSADGRVLARWDNFRGSRGAHDLAVAANGDLIVNHMLDGKRQLLRYRRCA